MENAVLTPDWVILYDQHAPMVYGMVRSFTTDEAVAKEILAGTFVQLKSAMEQSARQTLTKAQILKITCTHILDVLNGQNDSLPWREYMRKALSYSRAV